MRYVKLKLGQSREIYRNATTSCDMRLESFLGYLYYSALTFNYSDCKKDDVDFVLKCLNEENEVGSETFELFKSWFIETGSKFFINSAAISLEENSELANALLTGYILFNSKYNHREYDCIENLHLIIDTIDSLNILLRESKIRKHYKRPIFEKKEKAV